MADGKTVREARDSGHGAGRTNPVTFYRQVVAELRKVVWPTQNELVTYFFVVLTFVVVVMTLVSLLDVAFGELALRVFGGGGAQ